MAAAAKAHGPAAASAPAGDHAVATHGLLKRYGHTVALDGLDLAVPRGVVHGFLGPNGAGKTTTIRVVAYLLVAAIVSVILVERAQISG